jgi:hypothetical protein
VYFNLVSELRKEIIRCVIELFGAWSSLDNRLANRGGSTVWKPTAEELPVLIKAQESVRSVSGKGTTIFCWKKRLDL